MQMTLGPRAVHWSNHVPREFRVVVKSSSIVGTDIFKDYKWKVVVFPEYIPNYFVCIFKRKQQALELYAELEKRKITGYANWFY